MEPPIAKQVPHTWERPTGAVDDPWAWLRDRDDPDTIAYLEAENAYAREWFAPHDALVETIFDEIRSRVQETDLGVPVEHGGWHYVTRTETGASYPIHCRGPERETAAATVILDQNAEAAGHDFFDLAAFEPSPDHRLLAWSADVDGGEKYTLRIRDLGSLADLDDIVVGTSWAGVAWSRDARTVFYVMPDEQMRPFQVWRHEIGTAQADDVLVVAEPDERFFVGVETTRSGEWVVISIESKLSAEMLVIPADHPTTQPQLAAPRRPDVEYHLDHWGDCWVVLTNLDAEDFCVMTAPLDAPGEWEVLVAHVPGRRITAVEPFAGHLVLHEWSDAQQRLRLLFRDGSERILDLGTDPHEVELSANPQWETRFVRYVYQSLVTPPSVFEADVATGEATLLKRTPTPGVDLEHYVTERTWATASDGTSIPLDIVRAATTAIDGTAPAILYGYGSYEASMPPWFSVARLSLLDRGFVWALAHPRGGGELGRRWYLDGKLLAKRNTFTDTIACAEHLVAGKWAASDRLVIRGASAGGLLVGACITMRPELFAAAIAEVPFVDVVTSMSDPTLPLTITEWEEWGDPRQEPYASYMLGYSPYDNTGVDNAGVDGDGHVDFPAMFVTAGLNDPRVSYHEPAKWVAKLRAVAGARAPLVLRCEMGAGHGGPSGRYDTWRDEARVLTFAVVSAGV